MDWSAFRNGTPLTVDGASEVRYGDLVAAGFAPFYAKVAFTMLQRGDAGASELAGWMASADDPKRAAAVKAELRAYHDAARASDAGRAKTAARRSDAANAPLGPVRDSDRPKNPGGARAEAGAERRPADGGDDDSGPAPSARRRGRRGRNRADARFVLVARGGSPSHARREAERLGLAPVETRFVDPAGGEVTTRLEVEVSRQQATTLTLSGFWMHRSDDDRPPTSPSARVRTRSRGGEPRD